MEDIAQLPSSKVRNLRIRDTQLFASVDQMLSYAFVLQEKSLARDLGGAAKSLPPTCRGDNHCKP